MEAESSLLEVESASGEARMFPLRRQQILIGRGSDCDLFIADPGVSRLHARLESPAEGSWHVVDLDSKNGTFVNESRVRMSALLDGDVMQIGNCRMTLRLADSLGGDPALELAVETPATQTIFIDSTGIPSDQSVPARLLADLHESLASMVRIESIDDLLWKAADLFRNTLRADRVAAGLCKGRECQWVAVVDGQGDPCDGSDLPRRLHERRAVMPDVTRLSWDTMLSPELRTTSGAVAAMCYDFALKAGPHVLGHVFAERLRPALAVDEDTLAYLSVLAGQIGLLLDRARLHESRQAAVKLQQELEAAREIQLDLFPRTLRLDSRVEIAARNQPCFGVSGDYYDYRRAEDGSLWFIVADVMGHGLQAALLMSRLQVVFDMDIRSGWRLKELDCRLNEALLIDRDEVTFATGLLGQCDLDAGILELLSAGHPWPSILVNGQRIACDNSARQLPWGVDVERHAESARTWLTERWGILGYTDGVAEAADRHGQQFGEHRITALHEVMLADNAEALCEKLIDDVLAHMGGSGPLQDDITVLAIRSR